jgi:hypothetical protein
MSISVFPTPVISIPPDASAITVAAANTLNEARATFAPAIYTITCPSGVITNFSFLSDATTVIVSGVTASGTVSINLASTADRIRLYTNTGTNTVVTFTKTAAPLTNVISGTLDTISTVGSSTYTGTSTSGLAYAVLVGGGGAGGGANGGANNRGGGGGAGGVGFKLVTLTGSMPVFIGSGGTGVLASSGNPGTASTFDGMSAGGGGGGAISGRGLFGTTTGADFASTSGSGGGSPSFSPEATSNIWPFVINGTTGGGGFNGAGAGGGIGTGGAAGSLGGFGSDGTAGTGFGSGGGGGASGYQAASNRTGGAGRPGVLYVLKF